MISVEDALQRCLALVQPLPPQTVPLRQSLARVMAAPVYAQLNQPPFAASAMDGYALGRIAAPGDNFQVIGEAGAGHAFAGTLLPHQAARIFTGAPVPEGAVSVAIQEDITVQGTEIVLNSTSNLGDNIRPKGQDFATGQVFHPRHALRPNDLALLAAMNIAQVPVIRRPVVALIATGDELVMPGESLRADQIVASNTFALAAMVEQAGGEARVLPIARDNEPHLRQVFSLTAGADLIVTIGGASVGDHDLVGKVVTDLGMERSFWKIAMRPGKPLMAGRVLGIPMLGLPGNPVSAIVCGHLFMLPMLRCMLGLPDCAPPVRQALLATDQPANGPRTHYMRARMAPDGTIAPFDRQDSALLSILTQANALLIRPVNDGARHAGERMDYIAL